MARMHLKKNSIRAERDRILGVRIDSLRVSELNDRILGMVRCGRHEMVLNVNIHCMNLAHRYAWLREMLNKASIVFCDGDGVRIGAKLLGYDIVEKITYNRWIWDLAEFCATNRLSWYLLGGRESTIESATRKLASLYPQLVIKGWRNGYFSSSEDVREVINSINLATPDVLILGMGMPLQEKWLSENFADLKVGVALTGGAVFDYISGAAKMTPDIFYRLKLEWLYRLLMEPKRLFSRYVIGNPLFFFRICNQWIKDLLTIHLLTRRYPVS